MKQFFHSMTEIRQHLNSLPYAACPYCQKQGCLVPHDNVYRYHDRSLVPVGKRIFCSNRYTHSGCGRTYRLYLAQVVPGLHYAATHVMLFITLLLAGKTIAHAYFAATQQPNPRHAYRWLNRLQRQCCTFRCQLKTPHLASPMVYRSRRFQVVLGTLSCLIAQLGNSFCLHFQVLSQRAFF